MDLSNSETRQLFGAIQQGHYNVVYSSVTMDELLEAPQQVKTLLDEIPETLTLLCQVNPQAGFVSSRAKGILQCQGHPFPKGIPSGWGGVLSQRDALSEGLLRSGMDLWGRHV